MLSVHSIFNIMRVWIIESGVVLLHLLFQLPEKTNLSLSLSIPDKIWVWGRPFNLASLGFILFSLSARIWMGRTFCRRVLSWSLHSNSKLPAIEILRIRPGLGGPSPRALLSGLVFPGFGWGGAKRSLTFSEKSRYSGGVSWVPSVPSASGSLAPTRPTLSRPPDSAPVARFTTYNGEWKLC